MHVNRKPNGVHNKRRGVIGIESAIVLIAFVIVAAALSFVVLNMGFSTTQKAKTTITSGLTEASSAIEVAGMVTGHGDVSAANLEVFAVPIKLASGSGSVNLDDATSAVKYFSKTVSYDNIYKGTITTEYTNLQDAVQAAVTAGYISSNPMNSTDPSATGAFIYWTNNVGTANEVLDAGESAVLVIAYKSSDSPAALDHITAEVFLPTGSPLSIGRDIPTITSAVVNMS